jgi:nicotinamidase-related amidase
MTVLSGSLRKAMAKRANLAMLVIDESGFEKTRAAQKEVLEYGKRLGAKTALVEFDQSRATGNICLKITTDPELKKLVPDAPVFTKYVANGFIETGLDEWLKSVKAAYVVVMGMETACCVEQTIVGAWEATSKGYYNDPGLLGRGYIVLSCEQIVHTRPGKWEDMPQVEFYDLV